jgi:osmotically-inducible protein OsmY
MNLLERWNRLLGGMLIALAVIGVIGTISWGCSRTTSRPEEPRTAGTAIHDGITTASVKLALAFEPGVAATTITVHTDRGVVTLQGEVRSEAERQLAEKVAEDVGNVTRVVNELRVNS